MATTKHKLLLEQLDKKLTVFRQAAQNIIPQKGWINAVRTSIRMSLVQFGKKLNITRQSAKEIEEREANGTITLKALRQAADVLDMDFVYGFIPRQGSLKKMVERKVFEKAKEIVTRTSRTMALEDQKVSGERLKKAIQEKAEEIINKLPRHLWD